LVTQNIISNPAAPQHRCPTGERGRYFGDFACWEGTGGDLPPLMAPPKLLPLLTF